MKEGSFFISGDAVTRMCAAYCSLGFACFVAWAGLIPLDEGVVAQGKVVVENNRRVVQHLEGGIIQQTLVREGQLVEAGAQLLSLSKTASASQRDQIAKQALGLSLAAASLEGLRDNAAEPNFSGIDLGGLPDVEINEMIAREVDVFRQRRGALQAELNVLQTRKGSVAAQAQALAGQITIVDAEREIVVEELELARQMLSAQMARRDQVTGLERELARLDGEISRLRNERQTSQAMEFDLASQIDQVKSEFWRSVSHELRDTEAELLSTVEALVAAQDVVDRSVITAPVSGRILNLVASTEGGVIAPGELLMEIVPDTRNVIVSLRIGPSDRTMVYEGLKVRTRLSAYRGWQMPEIEGEVITLSADLKTDRATGIDYYEALVELPQTALDLAGQPDTPPGMPVDAFIFSGRERTTLEMLFAPISESLFRGLRSS